MVALGIAVVATTPTPATPTIVGIVVVVVVVVAVTLLVKAGMSMSGPLYPKLSMCFEGARLTQLVQLVTAGRLFLGHKGRVDL